MTPLFISGLPRSGSTVLAAILRQNPAIHAHISSPVGATFMELQRSLSRWNEAATFLDDHDRANMLGTMVLSYYHRRAGGRPIVFDTNRRWCNVLPVLKTIWPDTKVVCCVRDPRAVMNSMEKVLRAHPLELSRTLGYRANMSVHDRAKALFDDDGVIGWALQAFTSAYYADRDSLIVVDYDEFVVDPDGTLERVYDGCSLTRFPHDLDNIEQIPGAEIFDREAGVPGMHSVKERFGRQQGETLLPPGMAFPRAFWKDNQHTGGF